MTASGRDRERVVAPVPPAPVEERAVPALERQHTLLTAAHRYDDLRLRHTLLGSTSDLEGDPGLHLSAYEAAARRLAGALD
ncbi:hypothetical protein [Kineococcus sp. SYSU DK018]|uniref:hypothetical protein n=1 Tax=Kineococcus sp. SYSU DK018 TaxID=3383139 RepID=UPI003D7C9A8D